MAASLHGLANVLVRQGKYEEAERTYRESVEVQVKAYGTREHAEVAASLAGLANVLESQGKYEEAERTYRESVEVKVKAYGTREHASVAASLHGLANVLVSQGKYEEAERTWISVVEIEERVFGSRQTPATIPTLAVLAQLLLRMQRVGDALEWSTAAWTASVNQKLALEIVQVGPIHIMCLGANEQVDAAREVLAILASALHQFPENHPVRKQAEAQLRQMFGSPES